MRRFQRVLFVVEDAETQRPALDRAWSLARANGARLTLVEVVPEISEYLWFKGRDGVEELQQRIVTGREAALERLRQSLEGRGVEIATRVLVGTPFLEIIREVGRSGHDLVIKEAEGGRGPLGAFLGSLDLHLLRKCPCPVWILKGDGQPVGRVLAAVDPGPEGEKRGALDRLILDLATSLARAEGADLHVVHAWELFGEPFLRRRMAAEEVGELRAKLLRDHRQAFEELLAEYDLEGLSTTAHLEEGIPAKVVGGLATELRPDVIVMGTVSRVGVRGLIMGNTAEDVLRGVECSLLAVKPRGFETPVLG